MGNHINAMEAYLPALNSMTKYPSIPTYHTLGEKGRLLPETNVQFDTGDVYIAEKVDGSNFRILIFGSIILIGSREEWVHAVGDMVMNPSQFIAETVRDHAYTLAMTSLPSYALVLYGEVFGKGVGPNAKQYSTQRRGFRFFDAWTMDEEEFWDLAQEDRANIARWRDQSGQPFMDVRTFQKFASDYSLPIIPAAQWQENVPAGLGETLSWLHYLAPETSETLDESGLGQAEGVVVRNSDRTKIAKIRYEDYKHTLKKGKENHEHLDRR